MNRTLSLTVAGCALAALLAGCAEQPAENHRPNAVEMGDAFLTPAITGLLRCEPLAADSASAAIGAAGGTITVGPHVLTVPAGALAATVTITAVAPSDTVRRVVFEPDGLTFAEQAELTMSYAGCDLLGSLLPKRVAQVSESLDIFDLLPSLDLRALFTTRAKLDHFSGYAVAW